jgi:hypothetical protein
MDEQISAMYQNPCGVLRQGKVFIVLVTVAFLFAVLAPPVAAEGPLDEGKGWEFHVAPYMWFLSLDGDVTVKGRQGDVDIGFSDIWDEFNIGGMVQFEGRKGRFGFWGNTIYANLGKEKSTGDVGVDPTVETLWVGFGGSYRLGTWGLSNDPGKKFPTVTAETYLGLRYTYLNIELDFSNVPIPDVESDQDWVEPLLGCRTLWDLSERWTLTLAGAIGGIAFGSDFAWDAFGLVGYRFGLFGNNDVRIIGGYRALYQNYDDCDRNDKFEWDVTLYGPLLGLVIPF